PAGAASAAGALYQRGPCADRGSAPCDADRIPRRSSRGRGVHGKLRALQRLGARRGPRRRDHARARHGRGGIRSRHRDVEDRDAARRHQYVPRSAGRGSRGVELPATLRGGAGCGRTARRARLRGRSPRRADGARHEDGCREMNPTEREALEQAVAALDWYHTIDLGDGIVTPGVFDLRPIVPQFGIPDRLDGKTVLDVGPGNGFFSFLLEDRGAAVTTVELPSWGAHDSSPVLKAFYDSDEGQAAAVNIHDAL